MLSKLPKITQPVKSTLKSSEEKSNINSGEIFFLQEYQ